MQSYELIEKLHAILAILSRKPQGWSKVGFQALECRCRVSGLKKIIVENQLESQVDNAMDMFTFVRVETGVMRSGVFPIESWERLFSWITILSFVCIIMVPCKERPMCSEHEAYQSPRDRKS